MLFQFWGARARSSMTVIWVARVCHGDASVLEGVWTTMVHTTKPYPGKIPVW